MRSGPRALFNEYGVDAREADGRELGPELNGEDPGALDVEVQESRRAAARRGAVGAFSDPAFVDELIDDRGDRGTLQS